MAAEGDGAPDWSSFDAFVAAKLEQFGVPGAVVAVVCAGSAVAVTGFGVQRRGAPGGVDENTRFQIGSISKFLTATAIGRLVDRGVVAWDRKVSDYSPETQLGVPYASEKATLRDYLAHRTGLPASGGDLLTSLGLWARRAGPPRPLPAALMSAVKAAGRATSPAFADGGSYAV